MLCTAGLGVAFCAKPKVQDIAEFRVNTLDLSTVLYVIGLSEFAVEEIEK
jgi:phosphoserine phosphatase